MNKNICSKYLYYITLAFISLFFLCFYIHYAFSAWFSQDDFGFLSSYAQSLHPGDIFYRSNDFGRFLTRNVYWYLGENLFGHTAWLYFLTNLVFLMINSGLLAYFIRQLTEDKKFALAASVAYFSCAPTVMNYAWISNSQHIIAHTFIFIFFILAVQNKLSKLHKISLVLIYLLGIYANMLANFSLLPVAIYWLYQKEKNYPLMILLGILALTFMLLSQSFATGAYAVHLNFSVFTSNLIIYTKLLGANKFILPFFILYFISAMAWALRKKDVLLLFFLTASVSFYLPFACLATQHTVNYAALSWVFFTISILFLCRQKTWLMVFFLVLLSVVMGLRMLHHVAKEPLGEGVRTMINTLQKTQIAPNSTICFQASEDFWWKAGFGKAFEEFVEPNTRYVLLQANTEQANCDRIIDHDTLYKTDKKT